MRDCRPTRSRVLEISESSTRLNAGDLSPKWHLRNRSEMLNDPLSDVLQLAEAKSVMTGGFTASGVWALHFPPPKEIKFSVIARGACWARLDGQKRTFRLEQGDVCLMPGRHGFTIGSNLTAPPRDAVRFFARKTGAFAQIGDGSEFVSLAGGVSLHPSNAEMLIDVLPAFIHIRAASPEATPLRWLVEQLVSERDSTVPGSRLATAQLAQLLYTQVLRAHLSTAAALSTGWLRAVCDARLAPALRLMHAEPGRDWKLQELAKASAMSRTSFAVHFKAVAGIAPLTYLTEWRMRLAQRTLREADASVAQVASSYGYTSESAFSHAFKRVTGRRPRDYRSEARRAAA